MTEGESESESESEWTEQREERAKNDESNDVEGGGELLTICIRILFILVFNNIS
jgi:hypothetical protein